MVIVGLVLILGILGWIVYEKIVKNERIAAQVIRERELDEEVVRDRVYDPVLNDIVLDRINKLRVYNGRTPLTMEQAKSAIDMRKLHSVDTIISSAPGGKRQCVDTNEKFLEYLNPDYAVEIEKPGTPLNKGIFAAIDKDMQKNKKTK
jgi:hypothetical protein